MMAPEPSHGWMATSEPRVQVRPQHGRIPIATRKSIIGWQVRVWWPGVLWRLGCNLCYKHVGHREVHTETAMRRPDFDALRPSSSDGFTWVPYAHECSSKVPWATGITRTRPGWEWPHHHPAFDKSANEPYDARATPILFATAQLAYAAGLRLLNIDNPRHQHWQAHDIAAATTVPG
jgi:hypothetical protein